MTDVGLGQLVTVTGRHRSRKLKDAVSDNHPLLACMKKEGGIRRIDGGRTVVEEAMSGQNTTVDWVGESGQAPLVNANVLDAAEYGWKYQLGSITITHAERYKNSGGSDTKLINLVAGKYEVLEASAMNEFHAGMLSAGTGSGGLQLNGLGSHISTTPAVGTRGTIDTSSADAAWFRSQKFDTGNDWADGAMDAGNAKRLLDKALNSTTRGAKSMIDFFLAGTTHFEFITQAIQAIQVIQNESGTGHAGFQKLVYRGVDVYLGGGINFSGESALTATRTYGICVKPGGLNLVFHDKAEFDLLEEVQSSDQAAISRLMFTMCAMTSGGLSKFNHVIFD